MSTGEHRRLHTTLLAGLRVFTPMLLCCSDEGTPYNYFVCCPTWTERLEGLMARFWADMRTACPDFSPAASSVVPELGEGEALPTRQRWALSFFATYGWTRGRRVR